MTKIVAHPDLSIRRTSRIRQAMAARLPTPIKSTLKLLQKRFLASRDDLQLLQKIFLARLGIQNDFTGYEALINHIEASKTYELKGDFLEVGAFMGGGSAKLARFADKHSKRLIVIDLFDPNSDHTENNRGQSMSFLYRRIIGQKDLRKIFDRNTQLERNIVVYGVDSKRVKLPADTELCFSFIDGNHDPEYVKNDFYLAWNATVSGGVVAFHDYGGNLPQVTNAINGLIRENNGTINNTCFMPGSAMLLVRKQ